MNTSELVDVLAEQRGMTKAETRRLLDVIVETFSSTISDGHSFTIPELGTFSSEIRDKRKSYNPHYDQYMNLPPKCVVKFSPGKNIKEELKQIGLEDE